MRPFRGIRLEVDTKIIENNIRNLRHNFPGYDHYIAVIKGNAYGIGISKKLIDSMKAGGADYLAVCYMDEALRVRELDKSTPVLCLDPAGIDDIAVCIEKHIDVTVADADFAEKISHMDLAGLRVHIKVDSGLGRYGMKKREDITSAYAALKASAATVQGIYTHLLSEDDTGIMMSQIAQFKELCGDIDLSQIPIVHIPSGEAMTLLPKIDFINGTRVGSATYGLIDPSVGTKLAFSAVSEVEFVRTIKKGETIGYRGSFSADLDGYVAMIPVGYSDGFMRAYRNNSVKINGAECPLIGGIFMCQCYAGCDEKTKAGDRVVLFDSFDGLSKLSERLSEIPEEIILALKPTEYKYL